MNTNHQDVSSIIDIQALKYQTLNRIPKKAFINNYAPLLFDENPATFNLKWLEVAGSPTHEVVMTDEMDTPICLIPPLRETILDELTNGKSLTTEVDIYSKMKDIAKAQSENRLGVALANVNLFIGVTEELKKKWMLLLTDCGFEQNIINFTFSAKKDSTEIKNPIVTWDIVD